MSYEDKTLTCVQCSKEFVFSAGEQAFYAERDFNTPPKRCKACRKLRRQGKSSDPTSYGEYRSPSFERSAPDHQKIRGRHGRGGRGPHGGGGGGGPGGDRGGQRRGAYRSPAFREQDKQNVSDEYRSPGFRERDELNPDDEYRSPGFHEYDNIKPEEEYRSPGYRNQRDDWQDEKPMFSIVCSACGKESMVPFLPEEKDDPMCPDCFKLHRRMLAEEAAKEETPPEKPAKADPADAGDPSEDSNDQN
ncbi:MAG: zinc-ribbon domain containing protein [Deltaproteobacteria bacterium]|nr:zinc-ribbon domain containing protein [Deltaproteobacteria bacterium]